MTSPEQVQKKTAKAVEKKNVVLEKLKVEYVPVGNLRPNQYNPNRQSDHDFELLLRSMREDGFTQPIVAQRNGEIVDGEHRWRAGQALGMAEVPVVFVDMTPEQMRIATLRHNRARGSEDVELASAVLRDLAQLGALDYAQDSLLLDDVELQRMIEDIGAPEALAGDDYSGAWEPSEADGSEDSSDAVSDASSGTTQGAITAAPGGGQQMQAASAAAIEKARERERALALAKSAEEREAIKREASSFFRLQLLFEGAEADLVQRVLGDTPAQRLVEICTAFDEPVAEVPGGDAAETPEG